jgi:hypothetical protein
MPQIRKLIYSSVLFMKMAPGGIIIEASRMEIAHGSIRVCEFTSLAKLKDAARKQAYD